MVMWSRVIGLTIISLLFLRGRLKHAHWSLVGYLGFCLISGIYIYPNAFNHYRQYDEITKLAIRGVISYSTLWFIVCLIAVTELDAKSRRYFELGIGLFCVASSLLSVLQAFIGLGPDHRYGLINNSSMSGSTIAYGYPFVVAMVCRNKHGKNPVLVDWLIPGVCLFTPIIAIFLTKSSMAAGTLAVVIAAWFMTSPAIHVKQYTRLFHATWVSALILFGAGFYYGSERLLSDSGRFKLWGIAYDWWNQYGNHPIGMGLGTTSIFLPYIQKEAEYFSIGGWKVFLNSDWLQAGFEQGYAGLGLVGLVFAFSLAKSCKKPGPYFAAISGVAVCALANWPVHQPFSALIAAYAVGYPLSHRAGGDR